EMQKLLLNQGGVAIHLTRSSAWRERVADFVRGQFLDVTQAANSVFMANSSLWSLAKVADGGLLAYLTMRTAAHDLAPALPLVLAVGGKMTDWRGAPLDFVRGGSDLQVLASAAHVHESLQRLLAEPGP